MLKRFAFFLAVLGLLVAPAVAQDRGIAFATASDGSYGACFDTDVAAAFYVRARSVRQLFGLPTTAP